MTTNICVRILGVNGNYMTADEVTFTFDSQRTVTLKGAQPGDATRYVAEITETPPTGVLITAKKAQYYDTSQHFAITVDGNGKPTLQKDQTIAKYVDEAYAAYQPDSTKPDWNVDVNIYLGQFTDVTDKVNGIAQGQGLSFALSAQQLNKYSPTIINSSTAQGWTRFNGTSAQAAPSGRIVFLERSTQPSTAPKLYALYLPPGAESGATQFNVFLHPRVKPQPQDSFPSDMSQYPYHWRHIDFLHCYALRINFVRQQALTGKRVVLVLPTGSVPYQMANITSSGGMLQLLVELKFWLVRCAGFAKGTGIGRCGVTAFSYGGVNLESLFASCKAKGSFGGSFYDNFWRELIMFDPVPSSPDSFVGNVKSWYASGAKGRNFRIYTQPNNAISWYQSNAYTPLAQALAGGSETKGADGAFETDLAASGGTGGATALFTPPAFWNGTIAPQPTYDNLHPTFPFAFMQHALDNSNFT